MLQTHIKWLKSHLAEVKLLNPVTLTHSSLLKVVTLTQVHPPPPTPSRPTGSDPQSDVATQGDFWMPLDK